MHGRRWLRNGFRMLGGARRTRVAIGVALVALAASSLALVTGARAGAPAPVQVTPGASLPKGASATGATPSATSVSGAVVLKPRNPAAFHQFLASVTNRQSASYRDYLSPGDYASQYGPTAATVSAVKSALSAKGLTVTGTDDGGTLVDFSGSAATVDSAFSTHLENVRLAGGALRHAATNSVAVPASIGQAVESVVGLDTLVTPQAVDPVLGTSGSGSHAAAKTGSFTHPTGSPTPCADATNDANQFGGLTDEQIANAYGAFGLYGAGDTGAGQHIAVYELEPFSESDLATFDQCYFGSSGAAAMAGRLKVHSVDGGQPSGAGSGEAILDVEDVSAMAPGASIDVYEAPNTTFGGLDEYASIVNTDADQEITSSWGLCEQGLQAADPGEQQAENEIFEQAAAQGETTFAAAGDTGDDDCDSVRDTPPPAGQNPLSVDDPASQPYVVGVGGTTITNADTVPATEQVWNDGGTYGGGGGGISQSWQMPSWQRAATVPGIDLPGSTDYQQGAKVEQANGYPQNFCQANASAGKANEPCRLVPDVSAQADEFTGAVTIYSSMFDTDAPDGWITIGGTSSATPIWAAMYADVNASPTCQANPSTQKGAGFASPLLYGVASDPSAYAASFNDISTGNNDIFGQDDGQVFPARTGYDLASGLGSPRLTDSGGTAGLAYYACTLAAGGTRPTVTGVSPSSGSVAGGETVTVIGTGFRAGKGAGVKTVQVGTDLLKPAQWKVTSPTTITVTVPPAASALPPSSDTDGGGAVQIVVSLKNGLSSATSASSTFQYVDTSGSGTVPDVTSVGPFAGSEAAPAQTVIHGSGFTGATQVTFGGVPAATFTVNSANQITATPAAYSKATQCAALPSTGVYAGDTATNDICQVEVQVTGPAGTSTTSKIQPPPEGTIVLTVQDVEQFPDCAPENCEVAPAATEYDYAPAPTVSSISTSGGPSTLASEKGTTVVTVHGTGLNDQTLEWTDFGPPGLASSQDTNLVYATGTEIQVTAPTETLTTSVFTTPFSVKSIAGQSNSVTASFAGVPVVSGVTNDDSSTTLDGVPGAADTGGTPITVTGQGFAGQLVAPLQFNDIATPYSAGLQYTYSVVSDTKLTTQTVQQNPAIVDVQACTVTGCSAATSAAKPPTTADEIILYPVGTSAVSAVSPNTGPAAGGTKSTISGQNLGCPLNVYYGNTAAATFTPGEAILDCGSETSLSATSPAGSGTVPVTVQTITDYFTGAGRGTTSASFSYTK